MFGGLIAFIAIVALVVVAQRQQKRLRVIEADLQDLRKAFLSRREGWAETAGKHAEADAASPQAAPALLDAAPPEGTTTLVDAPDARQTGAAALGSVAAGTETAAAAQESAVGEAPVGPWSPSGAAASRPAAAKPARPTIETALGTRWAVWVGGLALALGGLFLVRYSIEAGIFGPEVRLIMAAVLGITLVAVAEFIRRTGFQMPVEGIASAYLPGVLTAAGAFTLFGTVYAAHGVYGFIGPSAAFALLGAIGIATIVASLVHGQALAGVGIVGSYVTPLLISSQAPNHWALFGFIAIVLVAAVSIARLRDWTLLAGTAFAGAGLWTLLYLADAGPEVDLTIVAFITAVTLSALAFVWLGRRETTAGADTASFAPALFVALTAITLLVDPEIGADGASVYAAAFIIAMLAVALARIPAIALLHAGGAATALVFIRDAFAGDMRFDLLGLPVAIEGFPVLPAGHELVRTGTALGVAFALAGLWSARRFATGNSLRATAWAAWGVAVPLVVLFSHWFAFGNLDRDLGHAAVALVLAIGFALAGEAIARAEEPPLTGRPAVSFVLAGAGIALLLGLQMGFSAGWTTILLGAALALPAFATRYRTYAVLGWLSAAGALAVLLRYAIDPTVVGSSVLSQTPVFNFLLPGYGLPALGAAFAGWQLARTTGGRPRLIMEAAASFFVLIGAAMLVRHAMHGGVIDTQVPTLAEQSIYTLIALAGSAVLIALDTRSPSPVFRVGSMAIGLVSVAMVVIQHFLLLNPLYTDELTGTIPFFNLLLLGYLLPALAAGGVALFARGRRPQWYVALLAVLASLLAFAYATLSLRRLFQGEFIALWRDFGQLETYAYSALWLALGVALLAAGLLLKSQVLRIASAALIVIAVAKVFLFDMSELEGVLRALSFIGLGIVLIGIGLFYQRMLTRAAAAPPEPTAATQSIG